VRELQRLEVLFKKNRLLCIMRFRILALIACSAAGLKLSAQGALYAPNSFADRWLQTIEIKGFHRNFDNEKRLGHFDPGNRFYDRRDVSQFTGLGGGKMAEGGFMADYIKRDNPEWNTYVSSNRMPFKPFYERPAAFYMWNDTSNAIIINPILNVHGQPGATNPLQQNTRGVELRGKISNKLSFWSQVTENQVFLPGWADTMARSYGVVEGEGFWKPFKKRGVDFLQARGYLSTSALNDRVRIVAGHDRIFTGNGIRSLILSDHAKEYLHLRLHTDLGPFRYQNVFARLNGFLPLTGDRLQPIKYMAMHRASVHIRPNLEFGLSEMVIFDRSDSFGQRGFDADYLNPVIFYRTIESHRGSRDNALLAFDWKWNFLDKFQFYGQFLLDEFKLKYLRENSGWWANKYAWQAGVKYTVLDNKLGWLFLQAEANRVRPYTYSHYRTSQAYTHYNQMLAHPLGSNFSEILFSMQWQPYQYGGIAMLNRFFLRADWMQAQRGKDIAGVNYGNDPRLDNDTRPYEFGHSMFQGQAETIRSLQISLSYMLRHNLFIDARMIRRSGHEQFFTLGLRLNAEARNYQY
jgi:hypothetical protein